MAGRDFGGLPRLAQRRHAQLPARLRGGRRGQGRITEVVRGADLVTSTFRQLLIYRALGLTPPAFYHAELMTDKSGVRLAKRHDVLSLRTLRAQGVTPAEIRRKFNSGNHETMNLRFHSWLSGF